MWRWGQQYRASVIQASSVVDWQTTAISEGFRPTQLVSAEVQRHHLPNMQGAPMPEMLQLHAWLEDNIPPTDPDASVTRVSHGDYR